MLNFIPNSAYSFEIVWNTYWNKVAMISVGWWPIDTIVHFIFLMPTSSFTVGVAISENATRTMSYYTFVYIYPNNRYI